MTTEQNAITPMTSYLDAIAAELMLNTEADIASAYDTLAAARKAHHEARIAADEARANLAEARAEHIIRAADSGITLGKNEAEREARLMSMTEAERIELHEAEQVELKARCDLDLAIDATKRIALLVAVLEMGA